MANIVVQSYGENRGQIDRHEAEGGVRNAMFAVFTKSRKEERRGKSWKAKAKNERTSVCILHFLKDIMRPFDCTVFIGYCD